MALTVDSLIQQPLQSAEQLARRQSLGTVSASEKNSQESRSTIDNNAFSERKRAAFSEQYRREKTRRDTTERDKNISTNNLGNPVNGASQVESRQSSEVSGRRSHSTQTTENTLQQSDATEIKSTVTVTASDATTMVNNTDNNLPSKSLVQLVSNIAKNNFKAGDSALGLQIDSSSKITGETQNKILANSTQLIQDGNILPQVEIKLPGSSIPFNQTASQEKPQQFYDAAKKQTANTEGTAKTLDTKALLASVAAELSGVASENTNKVVATKKGINMNQPNAELQNPFALLDKLRAQLLPDNFDRLQLKEKLPLENAVVNSQPFAANLAKEGVNKELLSEQLLNMNKQDVAKNKALDSGLQVEDLKSALQNALKLPTSGLNRLSLDSSWSSPLINPALLNSNASLGANLLPPLTFQLRQGIQSSAWAGNFAQNIAQMTINNRNFAEIRLDPPELGSILVKINQKANDTQIQFQVQNSDAKSAVENSLNKLRDTLEQQGFSQVNVDVQQQSPQYSQHRRQQADELSGFSSSRIKTDSEPVLASISMQTPIFLTGPQSAIDLFA